MEDDILSTLLLLALPASGKSEIRKYLRHAPPETRRRDFRVGDTVQLDDFPYVHLMRRIDEALVASGRERAYFRSPEGSFADPRDWGTLIHLLNEDHADLLAGKRDRPESAALRLFERLDRASLEAGAPARLESSGREIAASLENEARERLIEKERARPDTWEGKTLVVEFARGGASGSSTPLPPPFGYRHSLAQLSEAILRRAAILYVWVTPEESRRRNEERADPADPGSVLHHSVPPSVMLADYGCDDMGSLEATSERRGTVTVEAHGKTFRLPVARFDNRNDKTSFLREDERKWGAEQVRTVHEELRSAMNRLYDASRKERQ